jgi:hypothetical protein
MATEGDIARVVAAVMSEMQKAGMSGGGAAGGKKKLDERHLGGSISSPETRSGGSGTSR